eukprot:878045-Prymnesium_polylepis.1
MPPASAATAAIIRSPLLSWATSASLERSASFCPTCRTIVGQGGLRRRLHLRRGGLWEGLGAHREQQAGHVRGIAAQERCSRGDQLVARAACESERGDGGRVAPKNLKLERHRRSSREAHAPIPHDVVLAAGRAKLARVERGNVRGRRLQRSVCSERE